MARTTTQERVKRLESHLKQENPVLAGVVQSFRQLDRVARKLHLMDEDDSYATQVSWWPVIAVLGTFSAGKSTFLNQYTGQDLQRTGNQAVDDKFTVICYGADDAPTVLPGSALDADPRFPFYRISRDIEQAAEGEGRRVDSYLQLKTCRAEALRGKIFIDSPGFDADQQRTSTLFITDHIIDLSDLVLVFFDARHPEPGAMRDTLEHLVEETYRRSDAGKFMYVLNQIDTTAREDNPEEVVAAWQRALASCGLTAGRFYRIYNEACALEFPDATVEARFKAKKDEDLAEIQTRMEQVEVERAYRIIGNLEHVAKSLEGPAVERIRELVDEWRKRTLTYDGVVAGIVGAGVLGAAVANLGAAGELLALAADNPLVALAAVAGVGVIGGWVHFKFRALAARRIASRLVREDQPLDLRRAFARNTVWSRPLWRKEPVAWNNRNKRIVHEILAGCDDYIQKLNDQFTKPSG